jgi:hypothetical protein
VTETFDLGKDKPHPVTGLFPNSQFIKNRAIDVILRVKKALQIIFVNHTLPPRSAFFFPGTASRRAMLELKT